MSLGLLPRHDTCCLATEVLLVQLPIISASHREPQRFSSVLEAMDSRPPSSKPPSPSDPASPIPTGAAREHSDFCCYGKNDYLGNLYANSLHEETRT